MIYGQVIMRLVQGDLLGARGVLHSAEAHVDPDILAASFASGEDLYWVMDDEQLRRVLSLSPGQFDGDRGTWAIVRMRVYHFRHDSVRTALYADSARLVLEEQLRENAADALRHAMLGNALAHLGRKADAIREGRRAAELMPVSQGYPGYYMQHQLVRIYLLVNEPELALDHLEPLLQLPHFVTPGWIRIDPMFDPLRKHPRFVKLAESGAG